MSQVNLTSNERIHALVRLGYTEREAAFLSLAGLHSGYFLRRQYCQFIQRGIGGSAAALVEKILVKGHAIAVAGCHNAKVYHLTARPFYAALGQEDSQHRRHKAPAAIKNKLMCLDYVLDHPADQFLATEQEKVAYFTSTVGIDLTDLPAKDFRSPTAPEASFRFFVDKYPIFISPGAPADTAGFCFVDEETLTTARFESYLRRYRRLFAHLPRFEVVYVAASEAPFDAAERVFHTLLSKPGQGSQNGSGPWTAERLLEHFEQRRAYDAGRFQLFDRAGLIRLRNERLEFSGRFFDRLWRRWKTGGEASVREALAAEGPAPDLSRSGFSRYLLKHSYEVFSRFHGPTEL